MQSNEEIEKEHRQDVPTISWPSAKMTGTKESTVDYMMRRMRNATGIFHMNEDLCDVATAPAGVSGRWVYLHEVPIDFVPRLLNFGKKMKDGVAYRRFISVCMARGRGYYSMSDGYPGRWRGDYEGDRPAMIRHAHKQKDLIISGGTTGLG